MVHVVYVSPTSAVDDTPINKNNVSINEMLTADTEMRIVPNDNVPNSADSPTIESYMTLENADGFALKSMTNTMIITENS